MPGAAGFSAATGQPAEIVASVHQHFTLAGTDEAFLRKFRTGRNVLGAAVQLCTLRWLGFVPDDVPSAPAAAAGRLSWRLDIRMGELRGYGEREKARTGHLRRMAATCGWRLVDASGWKDLKEFLFARAMEHISPKLLFRLACEYLISPWVVRPGVVLILERVEPLRHGRGRRHGRGCRWRIYSTTTAARAGPAARRWPGSGWGRPRRARRAVKAELEKLAYLRRFGAHTLDLSMLPTERRWFLAGVGRRLTETWKISFSR